MRVEPVEPGSLSSLFGRLGAFNRFLNGPCLDRDESHQLDAFRSQAWALVADDRGSAKGVVSAEPNDLTPGTKDSRLL